MVVRAGREIRKGEEITHSYVDPQVTTFQEAFTYSSPQEPLLVRQELLHLGKFFKCGCARCRDPTELGTFSSALTCPKCRWEKSSLKHLAQGTGGVHRAFTADC